MDCGFGSIGPFNRAFKEDTGVTPGAYRAGQRPAEAPRTLDLEEAP
jgi:AraC-like DNA-binding protein